MNATGLLNTASNATVRIADEYAALRINSRIHEVEQVSIVWIVAVAAGSSEITNRATLHRIIRRGIGRDLHMTMDSRALKQLIDWNARAKRLAAVIAARAKRSGRLLRTIVNGVRIRRARRRSGCGIRLIWTRSYCLVIDA